MDKNKKSKGQYYTSRAKYILKDFPCPKEGIIIEPFAGQGDLIDWIVSEETSVSIIGYDIEPKRDGIIKRDTLLNPPNYKESWIITNPPYLARNKSDVKEIYDKYETNDLYKCFIQSVVEQDNCLGGILIIPAGFFLSPRNIDVKCRDRFLQKYKIIKMRYFEESVFDDTSTTVVAFAFEKSETKIEKQIVEWEIMPSGEKKTFEMNVENNWIIGGEIYRLPINETFSYRRYVLGQELKEDEQLTNMTLSALDSGSKEGRIKMKFEKDYVYHAKDCSRTYATMIVKGIVLSDEKQEEICEEFNKFIEKKRDETWSLFLPQYRESKEYARKRIPFELAYYILNYITLYKG